MRALLIAPVLTITPPHGIIKLENFRTIAVVIEVIYIFCLKIINVLIGGSYEKGFTVDYYNC